VSDFEKRLDPNATIQLDAIDALDLVKLEEDAKARAEAEKPAVSRRTAPPPLPPSSLPPATTADSSLPASSLPPASQAAASLPHRKSTLPPPGRAAAYSFVFLILLAGAIVGGLFAGRLLRGDSAPAASGTPAAPGASGSGQPLNMPAVEISGH
jgi:hypothetical protein